MAAPYEIIGAPYEVYVAPVGTTFPALDAAPSGSWFKLGTSGTKSYDDDGVTVKMPQKQTEFRGAGSTVPRKTWRTEEDHYIGVTLMDVSITQVAKVLGDAAITVVAPGAGIAGESKINLTQGISVKQYAVLARGISPANEALTAQYEMDSACNDGEPEVVYSKGKPAGVATNWRAIDAAGNATHCRLRVQTAAAS